MVGRGLVKNIAVDNEQWTADLDTVDEQFDWLLEL